MTDRELEALKQELCELLAKVRGNLSVTLIINDRMITITRTEYVDEFNHKVRYTELRL